MTKRSNRMSRRRFLQGSAAAAAGISIVPRHVLAAQGGQADKLPPSETLGGALIGCGGRGEGTFGGLGPNVRRLVSCNVRFKDKADDKTVYTDYRKVLERKDIDVVAIATHPGWHALISIAAMEAGKDVLCEKPMCRFIAEGRAVAEAEKRFGRIFQIGTFGRFGANRKIRKIFTSGLLAECDTTLILRGDVKVREWSGKVKYNVQPIPPGWIGTCTAGPPRCGPTSRIASAARTAATGTMRGADCRTCRTTTWTARATSTPAT